MRRARADVSRSAATACYATARGERPRLLQPLPKLGEKTELIGQKPSLGNLLVFDTQEVEARPLHAVTRGGNPFEFTFVCTLGRIPNTNFVAFGDRVINCHVQIGKADKVLAHAGPQTITPNDLSVDGKSFRKQLVNYGQISLVETLVYPTGNVGSVAFGLTR